MDLDVTMGDEIAQEEQPPPTEQDKSMIDNYPSIDICVYIVNYISCNHILRWVWRTCGWKSAFQHDAYSCEYFKNRGVIIGWQSNSWLTGYNIFVKAVDSNGNTIDGWDEW